MLAKMATRAEAARLLTVEAARKKATGERADLEAGMAKYFATEAAQDNALDCMRIHGGYGLLDRATGPSATTATRRCS